MSPVSALALSLLVGGQASGIGVSLRAEERAGVSNVSLDDDKSFLASEDPFQQVGADVMIEPNIHARTKIQGVKMEAEYAPQLVFRLLAGDARPLILHSLGGRFLGAAPRLTYFGNAGMEIGELDFSRAVRELKIPGSVPDGTGSLDAVPYMMFGGSGGAAYQMTRMWTLQLTAGASLSGASAEKLRTAFPLMSRPWVDGNSSWRVARHDTVDLSTRLETVLFSTGASYYGVSPKAGWTHDFGLVGALTMHAGALLTESTPFPGKDGIFMVHPIADLNVSRNTHVSESVIAESSFAIGVGPYFDPFTATLDERGSVSLGTKVSFGRTSVATSAAWLSMLNWARPEYGYEYIGGRGQQTDHIAVLDMRVVYNLVGPVAIDGGIMTLGRWDEPTFPSPTNPMVEAFVVFGVTSGWDWPRTADRKEEEG